MAALPNQQRTFDQMSLTYILSMRPSFVLDLNEEEREQVMFGTLIKEALSLGPVSSLSLSIYFNNNNKILYFIFLNYR